MKSSGDTDQRGPARRATRPGHYGIDGGNIGVAMFVVVEQAWLCVVDGPERGVGSPASRRAFMSTTPTRLRSRNRSSRLFAAKDCPSEPAGY